MLNRWMFLLVALCGTMAAHAADLTLRGKLDRSHHETYQTVPFNVPPGVQRITVELDYSGREDKSVIDLGVISADGSLRGWSGGNKRMVTLSAVDATPSYLPSPIMPGTWALLLGIPNIRERSQVTYEAKIYFSFSLVHKDEPDILRLPLKTGPSWYRGDLHSHTAHSDGSCSTFGGSDSIPCPVFLTAQAAASRKLDFLAITDHNTLSHASAIRELQPYFSKTLLMVGREITTFFGHANVFGTLEPIDFQLQRQSTMVSPWTAWLQKASRAGGLVSLNHPVRPLGEMCMGCAWQPGADLRSVQAIEVVNGPDADTSYSGIPLWRSLLNDGLRLTAIGGSDNHRPDRQESRFVTPIGTPTTVVYAQDLSQIAILEGIRRGNVYLDVQGQAGRALEFSGASCEDRSSMMGEELEAPEGRPLRFTVRVAGIEGGQLVVWLGRPQSQRLHQVSIKSPDETITIPWRADGMDHWISVDVRDQLGRLAMMSNPIYLVGKPTYEAKPCTTR